MFFEKDAVFQILYPSLPMNGDKGKRYKIFFINLDKSVERRKEMESQLERAGLPFERFSAIDGNAHSEEFFNGYYSANENAKRYYVSLSKTEIACYISHLKVCEKILSENLDYGIVLEDDIVLKDSFALVPSVLDSMANWNYIKLIAPFKRKKIVSSVPISIESCVVKAAGSSKSGFENAEKFELVRWRKPPAGTQAYAITKDGAKEFLEKRSRFFRPIDVDLQYTWETKLDIQGLLPSCCELADTPSGISRKKHYHYPFARFVYKFRYAISSICEGK